MLVLENHINCIFSAERFYRKRPGAHKSLINRAWESLSTLPLPHITPVLHNRNNVKSNFAIIVIYNTLRSFAILSRYNNKLINVNYFCFWLNSKYEVEKTISFRKHKSADTLYELEQNHFNKNVRKVFAN